MLDTAQANAKTAALNNAFAKIGSAGADLDTRMPRAKGNLEPVAWEYHVASHLLRIAEARKKKAQGQAVKLGVLFDPEKSPRAVGTSAVVYAGDLVEIGLTVTTPTTSLDLPALIEALVAKGVQRILITRLVEKHTHDNRAPHRFTSSLVAG